MSDKLRQVQRLIRPEILDMKAYHVPDSVGLMKLDAMENPYTWPAEMKKDWLKLMADLEPNRYPDPGAKELIKEMRSCFGIDPSLGVVLGNGSDELIQLLLMALQSSSSVMAPTPSFVMYQHIAKTLGLDFYGVPLQVDFSLDTKAMLALVEKQQPSIVFLAYPNNPTANLFNRGDIIKIINASDGLVVIDEAYQPFADDSFLDDVMKYPNVVLIRTVSKLGLAGIRLGYLVAHKALAEQFEKIRLPYNINSFTQLTAHFAFSHYKILQQQAELICQQRQWLLAELSKVTLLEVFPSQANFILFRVIDGQAIEIFEALKSSGILIKNMGVVAGLPSECLRVTVGSEEQNKIFVRTLSEILVVS